MSCGVPPSSFRYEQRVSGRYIYLSSFRGLLLSLLFNRRQHYHHFQIPENLVQSILDLSALKLITQQIHTQSRYTRVSQVLSMSTSTSQSTNNSRLKNEFGADLWIRDPETRRVCPISSNAS